MLAKVLHQQDARLHRPFPAGWQPQFVVPGSSGRLLLASEVGYRSLIKPKVRPLLDAREETGGDPEIVVEAHLEVSHLAVGLVDPDGALELF
jgi:hypothetical protein